MFVVGEPSEDPKAYLEVPCPKCGVIAGNKCHTVSPRAKGKKTETHADRKWVWEDTRLERSEARRGHGGIGIRGGHELQEEIEVAMTDPAPALDDAAREHLDGLIGDTRLAAAHGPQFREMLRADAVYRIQRGMDADWWPPVPPRAPRGGAVSSQVTDMLIFRDHPDGDNTCVFAWSGIWPPPETLVLARGRDSGGYTAFDPAESNPSAVDAARQSEVIRLIPHRRYSASEIDHRAPADAHWFRGALYVLVPDEGEQ